MKKHGELIGILLLISCFLLVSVHAVDHYPLWTFSATGAINEVDISADGQKLVAGTADKKVHFFHSENATPVWTYTASVSTPIFSTDLSDSGTRLIVGSDSVHSFLTGSGTPIWSVGALSPVHTAISADGQYALATYDGMLYLYSPLSSSYLWGLANPGYPTLSSDGQYFTVVGTTLYYYNRTTPMPTLLWSRGLGDYSAVGMAADGEYVVIGQWGSPGFKHHVVLFDRASSVPVWNYTLDPGDYPWAVAISADGTRMAAGGPSGKVYVFDQTGSLWNYSTGSQSIWALSFSASGQHLAVGTNNRVLLFSYTSLLWSCASSQVRSLQISQNGTYTVFGADDGTVALYHLTDVGPAPIPSWGLAYIMVSAVACILVWIWKKRTLYTQL